MSKRKATEALPRQTKPTAKSRKISTEHSISNTNEKLRIRGRPWVGAHVSASKAPHNAILQATHIQANSAALFVRNQRRWESKPLSEKDKSDFHRTCTEHRFDPKIHFLPHGSYLINLGNPDPEKRAKSYTAFLDELSRCEQLGIGHYNFHPGSTCGLCTPKESIQFIAKAINEAHSATTFITVVLENMAGQGNVIGSKFEDLAAIIELVTNKARVGVCLDTCHMFAAGYDIRTEASFKESMAQFETKVGFKYLKGVHLNDSKADLGSGKDRHESIGKGKIGLNAFRYIMNDPRFYSIPMVLETPVIDDNSQKDEVALLHSLITTKH